MRCGVGHRHGSDPELLWLWHRPSGEAPIGPLAWELPYATSVALKSQKKKKKREREREREREKQRPKGTTRLESLYVILTNSNTLCNCDNTKGKKFGLLWVVNCGHMSRKYLKDTCFYRFILSIDSPSPVLRMFAFPGTARAFFFFL